MGTFNSKNVNTGKIETDSGDVHLGDKITNIFLSYKPFLAIALFGFTLFLAYTYQEKISHLLGTNKVFNADDPQFKILIVPFKVMCKDQSNKDIGLHIKERLVEINLKDSINIYPYYHRIHISDNFNSDSAQYLQKYHNADQIIYGNYYDNNCSGIDGDEVCYNWITDEKWDLDSLQNNIMPNSNFRTANIKDLRKGKIQGSTDYIIYWIAGLNAYSQIQYTKALRHWNYIYEDLQISNWGLVNKLGRVYSDLGDYKNALKFSKELLDLSQTSRDSSVAFNNLALALKDLGDYAGAKTLLEKARVLAEENFGKDHPRTVVSYSNLALVLQDLGDYTGAKSFLEKVVKSDEMNFGKDDPSTAVSYSNLALVFRELGDYIEAKSFLEKAVESNEKNFGKAHPSTAVSYSNLALVLQNLGDYTGAKFLLEKAVESDELNFGKDHPTTAVRYSNLATVLRDLGDYIGAKSLLEKAIESDKKNFGKVHPKLVVNYSNLALVLRDLDDYTNAKTFLEKTVELAELNFGKDHPKTATSYSNLAIVLQYLGDYSGAKSLLEKAIESDELNFGKDHPNTATRYSNLAALLNDLGDYEGAKFLLEKAVIILKNSLPEGHTTIAIVSENLKNVEEAIKNQ